MRASFSFMLATVTVSLLAGCDALRGKVEPWRPVLEETGFSYLQTTVDEAIQHTLKAQEIIKSLRQNDADQELQQAMLALRKLHRFYVPMTEIRQSIYDADRLYYLQRQGEARNKLVSAKNQLLEITAGSSGNLTQVIDKLILAIDDLELAIVNDPSDVAAKFAALGEHVNLMTIKGELVLTESDFVEPK